MKKEKITIDELLTKVPNKYELAIISGKPKSEIMDEVFKDIMEDEVVVIREKNEENEEN